MVKSELVELLASKADITAPQSEEIVDLFFDTISKALVEEGRVEIRGFGAFTVRKYKSYEGRNPKTGEKIIVPEKNFLFGRLDLNCVKG
jgi:integration host factor subunit beta